MPAYEVVDPNARDERGVIYPNLTDAMVNAGPRLEVWELADDEPQTRMVRCWPDEEFEPRVEQAPDVLAKVVPITAGRPERYASELLAQLTRLDRETVHQALALAYATGDRDGYAACAADSARILRRLAP